jgi:hypothetical protein
LKFLSSTACRSVARRRRRAEQIAIDHFGDSPVAVGIEVDAVDRERRLRRRIQLAAGREEIDEPDALRLSDLRHRFRVQLEARVVLLAVREIGIVKILMRDRREQHDARR